MGEQTAISWCNHTFNIWWSCEHALRDEPGSPGSDPKATAPECDSCYAETFDKRIGGSHWGPGAPLRWFGDAYWAKPLKWNAAAEHAGERRRVFCSSMADWAQLHRDPEVNARMDAERSKLWKLILATPWLDWLLLTKRIERAEALLPWNLNADGSRLGRTPWRNVWLGTTCGARSSLWRVRKLRQIPAAVRFVSGEPLIEHITGEDWDAVLASDRLPHDVTGAMTQWMFGDAAKRIHWLIIGDESGPRRRPAQLDWIRTAREAAARHGVAFHFKQWNGPSSESCHGMRAENNNGTKGKIHLPILDGRQHADIPKVSR